MTQRYTLAELTVTTFRSASPVIIEALKRWITSMTPEDDDEQGGEEPGSTWDWLLTQQESFKGGSGFHDTFIFLLLDADGTWRFRTTATPSRPMGYQGSVCGD
jgi:hypothetical protein